MTALPSRLRSVLFMPGDNERALEKAKDLPVDALILDFEDAVAPGSKQKAREHVCRAVVSGGYGDRLVTIRVNSRGTAWHDDDLRAVAAAGPDAIVVPKVGSAAEVRAAHEIAAASERLAVLVLGTNDLVKELNAQHVPGREPLITSLSLCLLGARAAGKMILDGVYNDLRDFDGFEAECVQGRRFGFDGKTLIHPGQVDICNRVFSPSEAELEHARRVIDAFEEAARGGAGVVTVDGRMIEQLHVDSARRVLAAGN